MSILILIVLRKVLVNDFSIYRTILEQSVMGELLQLFESHKLMIKDIRPTFHTVFRHKIVLSP